MDINQLLANVNNYTGTIVSDGVLLNWITSLESEFFTEVIKEFRKKSYSFTKEDKFLKFDISKYEIRELEVLDENGNSVDTLETIDNNIDIYSEEDIPLDCMYAIPNKYGNCKVNILCRYIPKPKTLDNINNQYLDICRYGNQWYELYEQFLIHKSYLTAEEYQQSNNASILFNDIKARFLKFYYERVHIEAIKNVEDRWSR